MAYPIHDFGGKVAFVSGGGSGIGRAAALTFARGGAKVAVAGRRREPLEETVAMIEAAGGKALSLSCDVTKPDQVEAAIAATLEACGRLDFAFNNAGVEHDSIAIADMAIDQWDTVLDTNLRSVFLCIRQEVAAMKRTGGGVIVNVSSGAGVRGFAGQAAYCTAKHGLIGLTKAAALDYAKSGIRVNVICPGFVDTPMMQRFTGGTAEGRQMVIDSEPVGRPGTPEEFGEIVAWLCTDSAAFMVGHAMVVDGGQTI